MRHKATLALFIAAAMVWPGGAASAAGPRSGHAAATGRARLGRFPYLHWPAGVAPRDAAVVQPVGHFRFWDGSALQDVEGKTYLATLVGRGDRRGFDAPALRGSIERQLAAMGAVRVASGQVPAATLATINDADRKSLAPGLGRIGQDPVTTWTLRRPHRQLWVQYSDNADQASIAVVEATLN